MKRFSNFTVICALLFAVLLGTTSALADAWKFAVMGDTQWTCPTDPAGQNPNGVPVSIINQINRRLIEQGVKFVVQVGDLTENGNDAGIVVRARAAQQLYTAGIGFFPMRGNHETSAKPDGSNSFAIPAIQSNFPQTRGVSNAFGATNFSSPTAVSADLDGMSYSFDYGNARFVIIDNWATPSKRVDAADYRYGYSIADQQSWISNRLNKNTRGTTHAFVFSHQNLIGENHQDSIFTGYTNEKPAMQNDFLASLMNNDVKYYISGHDHIHQRSIVASPDGSSKVEELIAAPNSSKFYTPKSLTDGKWYGQKSRETSLSQEMYTIGYYIYTVDGPRVTVDYYSDDHGNWASDKCYPDGTTPQSCTVAGNHITPTFNFVKKETWGYSQNGKEILVPQGGSYVLTDDTSGAAANGESGYGRTTAKILSGTNGSVKKDYNDRQLTKPVDTGWAPKDNNLLASDIFTLWGMADLGAGKTDAYVLFITYDPHLAKHPGKGSFGIGAKDVKSTWVNAVNNNVGGTKKFVKGPWKSSYGLGTYGVDRRTKTAWAVVNYNASFAVANGIEPAPGHGK
ncbi:MAG TPA: metallophosphoesterase [Syntrophorhabdales bacterium]|nr:metallophosphoesterase [Syntrophorhabdales bacterium]